VLSLRDIWDLVPFDFFRKIVLVFAIERKFGLFMSVCSIPLRVVCAGHCGHYRDIKPPYRHDI